MSDEQKPVAWVQNLTDAQPRAVTDLRYCSVVECERGEHLKYTPLYTHPAPDVVKQLVGALKIISIWAKNGSTEKDFDDIAKLANETLEKAKEVGL